MLPRGTIRPITSPCCSTVLPAGSDPEPRVRTHRRDTTGARRRGGRGSKVNVATLSAYARLHHRTDDPDAGSWLSVIHLRDGGTRQIAGPHGEEERQRLTAGERAASCPVVPGWRRAYRQHAVSGGRAGGRRRAHRPGQTPPDCCRGDFARVDFLRAVGLAGVIELGGGRLRRPDAGRSVTATFSNAIRHCLLVTLKMPLDDTWQVRRPGTPRIR